VLLTRRVTVALYLKQSGVEFLPLRRHSFISPLFILVLTWLRLSFLLAIEHHIMSYSYTLPSSDPDPSNPDAHALYSTSSSADPLNMSSYGTESSNASSNMPTLNTTSSWSSTPSSTARNGPMKNWCDRVSNKLQLKPTQYSDLHVFVDVGTFFQCHF